MSLRTLPESLAAGGARTLRQLDLPNLDDTRIAAATRLFGLSEFARTAAARQREWLGEALAEHGFDRPATRADLQRELARETAGVSNPAGLQRALRVVRQRQQLWLVWRHLAGGAALEETVHACSLLADILIDAAYRRLYAWACESRGVPLGALSGTPQELVVLALGKLGGGELNLSSDVDLVFAYPESGATRRDDGGAGETNQQFFVRLGQALIQALEPITPDGFVFRVDMRLRPYGDSGPLVMDFPGLEDYYANQGRDWERYALIKARPCAGDLSAGERLLADLRPFIYRRYLDFGAIAALRDMKRRLLAGRQRLDDVKLGPGGIRDVEFSVQMLQLVWGGREPSLQKPGLFAALSELTLLGHLDAAQADALAAGYRFLRDTEHSIQAQSDQQTQTLPASPEARLRLAESRGYADFAEFLESLNTHRRAVEAVFDELVGTEPEPGADAGQVELSALWDGAAQEAFLAAGFHQAATARERLANLAAVRDRPGVSAEAQNRLDRLMPVLLARIVESANPDLALERVLPIIRAVLRRSAYLALLAENSRALERFVELVESSLWLAENLALHPVFLDVLLDERSLTEVPSRGELTANLRLRLSQAADFEEQLDALREFKAHFVFDVAVAELVGSLPLMKVSDALTFLAEAILEEALGIAWTENVNRFPEFADEQAFLVIGYGKLGGIELGPGSDLDLVFLHDLPGQPGPFLHRLVRRLLHVLTVPTYHGALYEIDTRLRPSGGAGTMVSSLDAFRDYQTDRAWVWEHQALVRARVVVGDAALAERFAEIRRTLLCLPRDRASLREEVLKMRERIREHHPDDEDLKRGGGGIVDIEFMVQYLVLAWAHQHPSLSEFTDNVRILDAVEQVGLLPAAMTGRLRDAYLGLRAEGHRSVLDIPDRERSTGVLAEFRNDVRAAWRQVFETQ